MKGARGELFDLGCGDVSQKRRREDWTGTIVNSSGIILLFYDCHFCLYSLMGIRRREKTERRWRKPKDATFTVHEVCLSLGARLLAHG